MSRVLIRQPVLSVAEASTLAESVQWFHRIELVPGVVSNGYIPSTEVYDAAGYIDSLNIGDLKGKRILELGTWDGPLAFELKQRGADVVASDIQNPENTGFNVLRKVSGLDIPYVRCSVYELSRHFGAEFDVILYFGVFYHLKHPILSFEEIAKCLKPDGRLFCEGEGFGRRLENLDGVELELSADQHALIEELDARGVPMTLSYPGRYANGSNWILPNKSALKGWLTAAGLDTLNIWSAGPRQVRVGATAVKVRDSAVIEHPLVGEVGGYQSKVSL